MRNRTIFIPFGATLILVLGTLLSFVRHNEPNNNRYKLFNSVKMLIYNQNITELASNHLFDKPKYQSFLSKEISDLIFSAKYLSSEYIEGSNKIEADANTFFIQYRISTASQHTDPLNHNTKYDGDVYIRNEYFAYQAQKDFRLINGSDTIGCKLYHFESARGVTPFITMILGFPRGNIDSKKDITIQYDDTQFNVGKINLLIAAGSISNLPKLKK